MHSFKSVKFVLAAVISFAGISIQSCNIINPAEPVPAYIQIDTAYLTTNYATEGSASHKIIDSWVYINNQIQGGYEMPIKFPVITTGNNQLVNVRPGIKNNGLSALRVIYPFFTTMDTTVNLVPGEVTHISPHYTYLSGIQFPFIEDFDDGSFNLERTSDSDTSLFATSDFPFEGLESGIFTIDKAHPRCKYQTYDNYTLIKYSTTIIELNYNTQNTIAIGLIQNNTDGTIETIPVIALKPTSGWNKIYINVSSQINTAASPKNWKVYFESVLDAGRTSSIVKLDNIKLTHN